MSHFPETSYSLIERVHDLTDEASWVEFLGIYQPVVYRMARRRGLQDADAQDVIQQVFASIARSIDGWKVGPDRPPFRAWLTTVSRNAITNALARKPRDRGAGSTSVVNQLHAQSAPEDTTSEIIKETRREIADQSCGLDSALNLLGPTDDPRMLGRIGPYEVTGVIGRGGMGVVFKAFDASLNRFVAIKMMLPHLATSAPARKRFSREGQAAAAVVDDTSRSDPFSSKSIRNPCSVETTGGFCGKPTA